MSFPSVRLRFYRMFSISSRSPTPRSVSTSCWLPASSGLPEIAPAPSHFSTIWPWWMVPYCFFTAARFLPPAALVCHTLDSSSGRDTQIPDMGCRFPGRRYFPSSRALRATSWSLGWAVSWPISSVKRKNYWRRNRTTIATWTP